MIESALDRAWRAYAAALEADYTTVLDRVLVMHSDGLLTEPIIVTKHLMGRHDQRRHDPHKGKGGPIGLQPDLERQARWKAMMDDPELNEFQANAAIRAEIEGLEGGPEALRQLDEWYYNPGNPDDALVDPMVFDEYKYEVSEEEQLDYPFEDWVYDRADKLGWNPDDDYALLDTMNTVKEGTATPEQVEAMSAIYDSTQAHIQHMGISSFSVHRGSAMDPERAAEFKKGKKIGTRVTGHWSADEDVSAKFAAGYYDLTSAEGREETTEVIIHKTFKPEEVFDYHLAWANKVDKHQQQVYMNEKEVVPVDGTEHKITKVESKKSKYGGLETIHVWVK